MREQVSCRQQQRSVFQRTDIMLDCYAVRQGESAVRLSGFWARRGIEERFASRYWKRCLCAGW